MVLRVLVCIGVCGLGVGVYWGGYGVCGGGGGGGGSGGGGVSIVGYGYGYGSIVRDLEYTPVK